jgi:ribosomal protein L37AE/L43A
MNQPKIRDERMSSQKTDCPVCGSRTTVTRFKNDGCWSCNQRADQDADDVAFDEFMAADSRDRWRALWNAAGQPTPY